MDHLLFAAFLILCALLVTRIPFFRASGLTTSQLIIFFLLKVMVGIFYGWIGVYYGQLAQMVDTWAYHYQSLLEYQILMNNPSEFFANLVRNPYPEGFSNFFLTQNSWWNDLKANFFVKLLALFNVLSFGNYYVNLIFYSLLSMFGPVALFRVMNAEFPSNRIPVMLASFLIPSFIYWTSGLHKDGLLFTAFGIVCYHFYFGLRDSNFTWRRILWIILGVIMILVLRNFLILALGPALLAWIISLRLKIAPILTFSLVYVFCIILFFTGKYIHPKLDVPHAVALKQKEFSKLGGGSAVEVTLIEPTPSSFIKNMPQAVSLSFLRPYPSDVRHLLSLAASVEVVTVLSLFLLFLTFKNPPHPFSPFLLFCVFFSFSMLLMIGYSVNILGAIVRYRSLVFPFLLVPLVARINWDRLKGLLLDTNIKQN